MDSALFRQNSMSISPRSFLTQMPTTGLGCLPDFVSPIMALQSASISLCLSFFTRCWRAIHTTDLCLLGTTWMWKHRFEWWLDLGCVCILTVIIQSLTTTYPRIGVLVNYESDSVRLIQTSVSFPKHCIRLTSCDVECHCFSSGFLIYHR